MASATVAQGISAQQDHNRLGATDREVMGAAVLAALRSWGAGYQLQCNDVESLNRIAGHAIGCGPADLRDSELAEIRLIVASLVGVSA